MKKHQRKTSESEDEFECDSGSEEILDSDEELQKAFERGELQSGSTYKEVVPEERPIHDVAGLEAKLAEFTHAEFEWIERSDLTLDPIKSKQEEDEGDKIHDDFKRELYFYRLAQNACLTGIPRIHKLGIPTKRPEDYFAQMIKSDNHMKKVREKLLSASLAVERSEKARKLRELKKMGKSVQTEVLKTRQKAKKDMLDQVKRYRKGQQDKLDCLSDPSSGKKKDKKSTQVGSSQKREWRNKKFGFGGQKKRSKMNTKTSHNDDRDYDHRKNNMTPNRLKQEKSRNKKMNSRPGKSKRQQIKSKKR